MKNKIAIMGLCAASLVAVLAVHPRAARSDVPALPACATDGDKDGDGVPDGLDSDETDSCLASATGFEDCATGAGDGLPDCQ